MKNVFLQMLPLLLIFTFTAQTQNCSFYIPTNEGSLQERINYDSKGKELSTQTLSVTKVSNTAEGTKIDLLAVTTQKKQEPTVVNYSMYCKGDKFIMDMKQFVPAEYVSNYKDAKVTATNIDYPASMQVGQTLNSGNITISITQEGMPMPLNTTVDITNRKVTAQETVTTPAGSFECFKVEFDMEVKMMVKVQFKIADWVALDVGSVKSETYNKNGKLQGYSLLTQIK